MITTNSKHTPGPWQIEEVKGGAYGMFLCITRGRGTDAIVQIHWYNRPINDEDNANARLIAVALDLLTNEQYIDSILPEWLDGLDDDETIDIAITARAARDIRAALARATGQSRLCKGAGESLPHPT